MADIPDPFSGGAIPIAKPEEAPKKAAAPKAGAPKAPAPAPVAAKPVTPKGVPLQPDKYHPTTIEELRAGMGRLSTNDPKAASIAPDSGLTLSDLIVGRHVHRKDPRPGREGFWETVHARTDRPAAELAKDFAQPMPRSWGEAWQQFNETSANQIWKADKDATDYVQGALQVPFDYLVGKPVEGITGGRVSQQLGGDIAALVTPFGEAYMAERAIKEGAAAMKMTEAAYMAWLKGWKAAAPARRATALEAARDATARRNAALKLIKQPGRERGSIGTLGKGIGELDAEEVAKNTEEWRKAHPGMEPTLSDVAGPAAVSVTRHAGGKFGEAGRILRENVERVTGLVTEMGRKRALAEAPNRRKSTEAIIQQVTDGRNLEAATKYRLPWSYRFRTDDNLFNIIFVGWKEGPTTVKEALEDVRRFLLTSKKRRGKGFEIINAEARQQEADLVGLDDYLTRYAKYEEELVQWNKDVKAAREAAGEGKGASEEDIAFEIADIVSKRPKPPEMPTMSAGALDRVHRIAVGKARAARMTGDNPMAEGISNRAELIDEYLENVPGLSEARTAYREKTGQIAMLEIDADIGMDPLKFKDILDGAGLNQIGLTKTQWQAFQTNIMQRVAAKFGTAAGRVELKGAHVIENLQTLLGKRADPFIKAIKLLDESEAIARQMAGGNVTARDMQDMDLISTAFQITVAGGLHRNHSQIWLGSRFLERWLSQTTPQENAIIARWMTQSDRPVEETMKDILAAVEDYRNKEMYAAEVGEISRAVVNRSSPYVQAILGHLKDRWVPDDVLKVLMKARIVTSPEMASKDIVHAPGTIVGPKHIRKYIPKYNEFNPNAPTAPVDPTGHYTGDPFSGGDPRASAGAAPPGGTPDPAPETPQDEDISQLQVDTSVPTNMDELLRKVAFLEGSGDNAISRKGAIGKYQIWPPTAERLGLDVSKLYDPAYNRYAASVILGKAIERFGSDLGAVLAEYNGGRGKQFVDSGHDPSVLRYETRKYLYRAGIIRADQVGHPEPGEGSEVGHPTMAGLPGVGEGDPDNLQVPDFMGGGLVTVPGIGGSR